MGFAMGLYVFNASNLKSGKILVMIMGFTNASGQEQFELKSQEFQEYGDHLELDIWQIYGRSEKYSIPLLLREKVRLVFVSWDQYFQPKI